MNTFYINTGETPTSKIIRIQTIKNNKSTNVSMFLYPIKENELINTINQLKNKTTCRPVK